MVGSLKRTTDDLAADIAADDFTRLRHLFLEAHARPPLVVWRPDALLLRSPVLQRLLAAWQSACPAPGHLPPSDRARTLARGSDDEWTMHLQPAPGRSGSQQPGDLDRFVYSHYGAGIARHYGRDMTGRTMTAFPGHIGLFFSAVYAAAQRRPEPIFTEHEPPANVLVRSWRRLILPFAGADGRVESFVVGNLPESAVGTLLDVMYDAALVTAGDGRIRLANRAAEALLGTGGPLLGSPLDDHLSGLTDIMRQLAEQVDGGAALGRHELALDRRDRRLVLEVSIGGTRVGGEPLFVLVLRDLTERAERERSLQRIAFKDELTGVLNRRGLHQAPAAARPLARRRRDGFGLLIVDIDGFKALNDTFGHVLGDTVLKTIAARLAASLRADDAVARWGGDEFVVVLHGIRRADELAAAGDKLLAVLHKPHPLDGRAVPVQVSIGGALFPTQGADFDAVLAAADAALYRAKSAGGGRLELAAAGAG